MDAEELFRQNTDAIDRIVMFVTWKNRLDATEGEDFSSYVKLKLVERNYHIIRKFEGRCAFCTYLVVVISRLFRGYRDQREGKWLVN